MAALQSCHSQSSTLPSSVLHHHHDTWSFGGPGEYNDHRILPNACSSWSFYFILHSDTTILSQLMSTRYRSELCLALGSVRGSVDPTTNTTSAPSVNEDLIQCCVITEDDSPTTGLDEDPTDTQWITHTYLHLAPPITNIPSQSMYTPYHDEPRHVPHLMYETWNRVMMRTADEQFASARMPPTVTQSGAQASCWGTLCRWPDESAPGICGAMILCDDVPAHFKDIHGIKDINESKPVQCRWEQCFAVGGRKNFVRHVRERHLGHSRDGGHSPRHSTGPN